MGVNLIFKIAAVGILVSVMCQVLKHSGREDQAFLTSLAGLILVLFWIVPYIYDLFETIKICFRCERRESYGGSSGGTSGAYGSFACGAVKTAEARVRGVPGSGGIHRSRISWSGKTGCAFGHPAGDRKRGSGSRHVYLAALFKMAGITYIAEFTSGICKDAGYSAVGTQVEMVGKLAILAVSAPVVLSLVETLKVFME